MSIEYGLITKDIEEKKIVAALNNKLQCYFEEMAAERYNLYKSYKFSKNEETQRDIVQSKAHSMGL